MPANCFSMGNTKKENRRRISKQQIRQEIKFHFNQLKIYQKFSDNKNNSIIILIQEDFHSINNILDLMENNKNFNLFENIFLLENYSLFYILLSTPFLKFQVYCNWTEKNMTIYFTCDITRTKVQKIYYILGTKS